MMASFTLSWKANKGNIKIVNYWLQQMILNIFKSDKIFTNISEKIKYITHKNEI